YGPPPALMGGQAGFYAGPWEALGLSQADFWAMVGAPVTNPANWKGVYNIDNNNITQDGSADLKIQSATGEGLLYVDGNLHVNANFHYVGLIYVEGDFDINRSAWILGGVICHGKTTITANGAMPIRYSADAINQTLTN